MNIASAPTGGLLQRGSGWKLAVSAFAVAAVLVLAGYWPTVRSLVGVWDGDGTYQYAFLIFPISLWLAFGLRHDLRAYVPTPSIWGLGAVGALVGIWYVGHALDVNLPQHFALVMLFPALVLACWGWRALYVLVFPLAYLLFAVPWGDGLVGPLQDVTARIAVHALNLTGIPVLLNGREILTPSAVWMVADACSGVKFFLACSALGCLYAYLMYQRWWKRVAFVVLSAVVPIIANGLRVYFTILIGEKFGLEYATGTDHLIFGWQFFGTVLVLLLVAGWFFRDRLVLPRTVASSAGRFVHARAGVWPLALVLLATGPVLAANSATAPAPEHLVVSAPVLAGWHAPEPTTGDWHPRFRGAAGSVQARYAARTGNGSVELFHAVYTGKPRRAHTLITYGNEVYDPASARLLAGQGVALARADGGRTTVRELRLASVEGSRLVWYWYCIGTRCTASAVAAKLLQAWAAMRGVPVESSVWAISTAVVGGGRETATATLSGFARELLADPSQAGRPPDTATAEAAR